MISNAQPRNINDLYNRHTRYEVAITLKTGETFVAAYMERKNKADLIAVARDNAEVILSLMPVDDNSEYTYSVKDGLRFADFAHVYYTGRTERDAAE